MPGMDGFALTRAIYTLAPHTPIILMSGHPEVRREQVIGAGAIDLIEKPILLDDLLAKIHLALRESFKTNDRRPLSVGSFGRRTIQRWSLLKQRRPRMTV